MRINGLIDAYRTIAMFMYGNTSYGWFVYKQMKRNKQARKAYNQFSSD